ncbi:MAG: aldose 1-epimerase [Pseudomonadota bacterium]
MVTHEGAAGALIELTHGSSRVLLSPAIGGAIAAFSQEGPDGPVHWLRPASAAALAAGDPLGMASFPLVPFCNRIRDGRFELDGRQVSLAPNYQDSPHTLHGLGWRRPWQVEQAGPSSASLSLDCAAGEWPYAFRATQYFRLDAQGLHVCISATNTGNGPMPVGLGHHPYFPDAAQASVRADVSHIWGGDAEVMPTTLDAGHGTVAALAGGMPVRAFELDNNFIGWKRQATVSWPGRTLRMVAQAPLDYLVLYTPSNEDFFCMEPVSNCTDWINLRHRHEPAERGGEMLAPGATLDTYFSFFTNLTG